jgi:Mg-chelatase subunit ChlD
MALRTVALALVCLCGGIAVAQQPPTPFSVADLLRPPGRSASEKIDWETIPPWMQTSFFGVRAKGKTFIYVVDCSGSMGLGERLFRAKSEIRRAVSAMRYPQKFYVIFYNDRALDMPGGIPIDSDARSVARLSQWFRTIDPDGETDPRDAMTQAIGLRPDAIFLLSDGEFPDGSVEHILRKNHSVKIPIHCIDLAGGDGALGLTQIAKSSGGEYVLRR